MQVGRHQCRDVQHHRMVALRLHGKRVGWLHLYSSHSGGYLRQVSSYQPVPPAEVGEIGVQ